MQDFLVLWLLFQLTSVTENCVINFMQPISILCIYMFSDIIPHGAMSKLHFYMDLTYHVL